MSRVDGALRILLQFLRAQDAGDAHAFRFEPQDYILPTAGGDSPSARFDWSAEVLADLQALRRPGRDPAVVQRLGERLRSFINDAGGAQLERQIMQAVADGRAIFLSIRSSAAELYALPWELLALKSGQYLGEVGQLLLRFEWPETRSALELVRPRPEGGRIVVAWSAAAGAVPAAEHIAAIRSACAAGFHPFNAQTDVIANASLSRIVQVLEAAQQANSPIAVLHLLCHGAAAGSTFGLALDGNDGAAVVDAAELRQQLGPFAKMVRLIVLSACDAGDQGAPGNQLGSVAQSLHRCGFHAVVASRYPLSVPGSIAFTESFYGELLPRPASLEQAFRVARKQLARAEIDLPRERRALDWASLQLYARHEDGDDTRPIVFRPYRGLLAFQPEHRRFFFGRDAEVSELSSDLQALVDKKKERFLVVAGASGTGKSSLVLAGAVPKLLEANPRLVMLRLRPGRDPNQALDEALAQRPADALALLVVDQLEEIFTQTAVSAERERFVRRLWSLSSSTEIDLRIIVTLRVDFIGRCGELPLDEAGLRLDRIAYDEAYRVFVAQLQPHNLRTAIVEPARQVGIALQAGLAERMIHDVGGEPGALPLLEDALDVLWQRRVDDTLTQAAYEELGGVIGALQRRADAIFEKLDAADSILARRLLLSLVSVADNTTLDTRLRVPLAELQHSFTAAESASFARVLQQLVAARLLVQDGDAESSEVEVAHEALIRKWPRLRCWLDEDREGLLIHRRVRQAAQEWSQHKDRSRLYRGAQLEQLKPWRTNWEASLGDLDRSFLIASDALAKEIADDATKRRRKDLASARFTSIAATVLGWLLVIAVIAVVLAVRNWKEARDNWDTAVDLSEYKNVLLKEAHTALLVTTAQTFKADPTFAAMLLREAGARDSTLWVQAASDALQTGIAETVLRGHEYDVDAVAFSPDGKKVATGSEDKTVRIWSVDGVGEPIVLKGHTGYVSAVAFSSDGKKLVSGSFDRTARIWNTDGTGDAIEIKGHDDIISAVGFSPDGTQVITGSHDKTARIWNADGSQELRKFTMRDGEVSSVAFGPDGKKVLIGSWDSTAVIWDEDDPKSLLQFKGHKDRVHSVAWSRDGNKIATASNDKTVRVWKANGVGSPIVLSGHEQPVTSVAFSPDGTQVCSGSGDRTARIWNSDGSGVPRVLQRHGSHIGAIAWSPDGTRVVTGSGDRTARIWRIDGAPNPLSIKSHEGLVNSIAFSADGKKVVTGSKDHMAHVWNSDGSGTPVILRGHADIVFAVGFSPDGKRVVTGSYDQTVRVWNTDGSGAPIVLTGHAGKLCAVAFSPDGTRILSGANDNTARIWNASGLGPATVLKGHDEAVCGVAWSFDGKRVLTGSMDNTARVWNADGSGASIVLKAHVSNIEAVAFSPDGSKLVTGSHDRTALLWNADGTGPSVTLKGHSDELASVAFSPDGKKVVTTSPDRTVLVWKADGSAAPLVLTGHANGVYAAVFSPDGTRVLTGSKDQAIGSWLVDPNALEAALWQATRDCLPKEQRRELLLESDKDAQAAHANCRQKVAGLRAKSSR